MDSSLGIVLSVDALNRIYRHLHYTVPYAYAAPLVEFLNEEVSKQNGNVPHQTDPSHTTVQPDG